MKVRFGPWLFFQARGCLPKQPVRHEGLLNDKGIISTVERHISEKGLILPGDRIVVAVSGGPDSVCLLHVLHLLSSQWDLDLKVAHFEHGLRGQESLDDMRFVEGLARDYGLEFFKDHADVRGYSLAKGICLQEAARLLRYRFLERVLDDSGAALIATAHTASDQAEEVLLRLLRGAGLPGLSGIPWKRGAIVRPLLGVTRDEVMGHVASFGLRYRLDSSNDNPKYMRNRVRKELVPFLEERFNPNIVGTINRTAALLAEEQEILDGMAAEAYRHCLDDISTTSGQVALNLDRLAACLPVTRRRVYRRAIEELGMFGGDIGYRHLDALDHLVVQPVPGKRCILPRGVSAYRDYHHLVISSTPFEAGPGDEAGRSTLITGAGSWKIPWMDAQLDIIPLSSQAPLSGQGSSGYPRRLFIARDSARFPLILRRRRPGDRFLPFGAKVSMRLKRFMINRKIPRDLRNRLPVIERDGQILVLAGVEVSEACRIRPGRYGSAYCLELKGFPWRGGGRANGH